MTGPIDQPEPQTPAPDFATTPGQDTVGSLLRAQRLALGRDVAFVAEHLRIRAAYIRAIEEGRYMDLPGSTYAIGFVRSYAEFLGLDVNETVRRFKDETAGGLHNKPELFFPSPVSEGRIPGGAILFLGLILAGTAYGAWYYMSSREVSIAELVPALPERLQAMIGMGGGKDQPPPAEAASVPAAQPESPPAPQPAKIEMPPPAQPAKIEMPPPPAAPAKPAGPATPPAPAATQQAAATPAVVPAATPATVLAPAAKPAEPPKPAEAAKPATATPPAVPAVPAAKPVEQAVPPDEEEDAPKPVRTVTAPAVPTDHPPPADGGKVYGAYNSDSRTTLRALDTVWLQVRDKDKAVFTQTLRKGDVYRVPNTPGLTLMTGSAGGIEVFVDGKHAPSLGQMGSVRRGIQLDPEKLLAGQ